MDWQARAEAFLLCFVPLFVAMDAVGVLPLFASLTEGLAPDRRRAVLRQSMLTAGAAALLFLACGPLVLRFLGIRVSDFMIAGGLTLLAISLADLVRGAKGRVDTEADSLGAVPIGVPLITGPAVLTTSLLLAGAYGRALTAAAIVVNILVASLIFACSDPLVRLLGRNGSKVVSKMASLLLVAIAVMLVRRGVVDAIAGR